MRKGLWLLLLMAACWSGNHLAAAGSDVRPVRDDVGFFWEAQPLNRLMQYLTALEDQSFPAKNLVAAISPHDDYLYAGRVYFPLFHILRTKEAVIFGVTHAAVRQDSGDPQAKLILDEYPRWRGLGREIEISPLREYLKAHLPAENVLVSNRAHDLEHSVEAMLPFLNYFNPNVRITPIMVTAMPFAKMEEISQHLAEVIVAYMKENKLQPGRDIFFLISADANHYGPDFQNAPFGLDEKAHRQGIEQDVSFVRSFLTGPMDAAKVRGLTESLWGATYRDPKNTYWCGKYSIPLGVLTVEKVIAGSQGRSLRGQLFRYADTYSGGVIPLPQTGYGITAPFSLKHWVGFFSLGFYMD